VTTRGRVQPIAASFDVSGRDISACRVQLTGGTGRTTQMDFSVIFSDASEHRFTFASINQQMRRDAIDGSLAMQGVIRARIPARMQRSRVRSRKMREE
jgi:hypothetical protein